MVVRVYERVVQSPLLHAVYVATDSVEIRDAVISAGGRALLTSIEHASGTDRVAEGARQVGLRGNDIVVNIQGDQPTLDVVMVSEVMQPLREDPSLPMSTLVYRIVRDEEVTHPNAVKTVLDRDGFALYFSRSSIPYVRPGQEAPPYYKHHGIYAYRNDFLQHFATLSPGLLERKEGLEQLRALEYGFSIKAVVTQRDSIEVDTPEDLARVRKTIAAQELTT
jgi:3-deoxy-manno-octulosonate cytidylyltransferase (CMP-KDO synthetase)